MWSTFSWPQDSRHSYAAPVPLRLRSKVRRQRRPMPLQPALHPAHPLLVPPQARLARSRALTRRPASKQTSSSVFSQARQVFTRRSALPGEPRWFRVFLAKPSGGSRTVALKKTGVVCPRGVCGAVTLQAERFEIFEPGSPMVAFECWVEVDGCCWSSAASTGEVVAVEWLPA
jgi:hypothetical protein